MSLENSTVIQLNYGKSGRFSCEIDAGRLVASVAAPRPNSAFRDELRRVLQHPLDFPPLEQAIISDDRIVLALDRHTPESMAIVAEVWNVLAGRQVDPKNVLIIQPKPFNGSQLPDPRSELPESVREMIGWIVHDPEDTDQCAYLAATATGERIFLTREAISADFVLPIGPIAYDPVIGYRGTGSVLFPGLSTSDAIARAQGQGHSELGPDDERPLRQIMDEVSWLLGTQFAVQVIPSAGGGVAHVLAGAADSTLRRGKELLKTEWSVELGDRPDMVIAAVEQDAAGHGWEQAGAALAVARNLVARGGRIVVLSELAVEPGAGMQLIAGCDDPSDAIQPLRTAAPEDLIPATQLADAVDWADVYLLSRLDSDLVEDLFIVPIENEREVERLLSRGDRCVFLESAQHVFARIHTD